MSTDALEPITDNIGDFVVRHGERDDLDPKHPLACLCGYPDYLFCPDAMGEGSIFGAVISKEPDGTIRISGGTHER